MQIDTHSAAKTALKLTLNTQMKGSCASTYTPSLSRLSPPAIHKQIEPHTPTPTPTRLLTDKHPILGPDPVIKEGTLEQPSTILIELPGKPVLEVTSLRIADREPLSTLLLRPCEPVFNPLSGEVPQSIADEMDNKLYVGAELKEVSCFVNIICCCYLVINCLSHANKLFTRLSKCEYLNITPIDYILDPNL